MSGDSEAPPTYYFNGITFNPDFYQTSSTLSSGDYLTPSTGKSYFLSYPTAQGEETISTLKTSSIDTETPTSTFGFLDSQTAGINIGNSSTGTIKLGSTNSYVDATTYRATNYDVSSGGETLSIGSSLTAPTSASTIPLSIGTSIPTFATTGIQIGGVNTNILMRGPLKIGNSIQGFSDTSTYNLFSSQTTGNFNICTSTSRNKGTGLQGQVNIATNATDDIQITIGNDLTKTSLRGTLTLGTAGITTYNLGAFTSTELITGTSGFSTTSASITSAGDITGTSLALASGAIGCGDITSTGNIATTATSGTITAPSGGSLIGPYKNAVTSSASITTAGQITGTSLVLGTGAIGCGAITSTGNISTSSASGTITAPSGGFLIGPYKNAATSTASITAAGIITGTKLLAPTIDTPSSATSMYLGSNLSTGNLFLGSVMSTGNITIGRETGNHTGTIKIGESQTTGVMEIATKSTRTASLFINSTTGQTNSIYIGATGTKTILDGDVSISKPLTLPTTAYTPSSTQLGYTLYGESNVETTVTSTSMAIATITNLPVGVYYVTCYCTLYSFTIGATQVVTMSDSSTGGIAASPSIPRTIINGVSTTFQTTPTLGGIVRATSNINTLSFNIVMTSGGGQCFMSNYGYYAIKIA